MSAGIVELLSELGNDKIQYQLLNTAITNIKRVDGVSVVSFATDAITPNDVMFETKNKLRGIVLWVDIDEYTDVYNKLNGGENGCS